MVKKKRIFWEVPFLLVLNFFAFVGVLHQQLLYVKLRLLLVGFAILTRAKDVVQSNRIVLTKLQAL
ncbi:MAG: hypothetical protein MUE72_05515 [Chitinophagaceae bacterium]|jgi:hypothetical protein|nr:hypothetical protein [Chitinophagaceae bacterium]